MQIIDKQRLLSPAEVAAMLSVKPITVRKWSQSGALRAEVTPGGHRRYRLEDVNAFVASRKRNGGAAAKRILVVDDDPFFCKFMLELIRERAPSVVLESALNGFGAGQKIRSFLPDILLLDINMPGLSGLDVCRQIKSDKDTLHIEVVAISGMLEREKIKALEDESVLACLAKPVDQYRLFSVLGLLNEG